MPQKNGDTERPSVALRHDVRYVDCIDNDTIIKKAAENPGSVGREIPRIDWVWTPGKRLRSCIPAHVAFDYCVATHVMEHVPDTIGWLNQIFEVMHDGAVLALALPDRATAWTTIAGRRHSGT
jgi:trans-aconitate methyltransferase